MDCGCVGDVEVVGDGEVVVWGCGVGGIVGEIKGECGVGFSGEVIGEGKCVGIVYVVVGCEVGVEGECDGLGDCVCVVDMVVGFVGGVRVVLGVVLDEEWIVGELVVDVEGVVLDGGGVGEIV